MTDFKKATITRPFGAGVKTCDKNNEILDEK